MNDSSGGPEILVGAGADKEGEALIQLKNLKNRYGLLVFVVKVLAGFRMDAVKILHSPYFQRFKLSQEVTPHTYDRDVQTWLLLRDSNQ